MPTDYYVHLLQQIEELASRSDALGVQSAAFREIARLASVAIVARTNVLHERAKHPCWKIEFGGDNWRKLTVWCNSKPVVGIHKLSLTFDLLHGPELHVDSIPCLVDLVDAVVEG